MKLPEHEQALIPDHKIAAAESTAFGTNYIIEGPLLALNGRVPRIRVMWHIATGERIRYTVEFLTLSGETVAVVTVAAEQIRPIRTNEIAHVRELAAA